MICKWRQWHCSQVLLPLLLLQLLALWSLTTAPFGYYVDTAVGEAEHQTPLKPRIVFQHVWKTGGTELCRLARANNWSTPLDKPGCAFFCHPDDGWPKEDFDIIGNEGAIPGGEVENVYTPRGGRKDVNYTGPLSVHDVKWITILRHPYARTLSHFRHVTSLKEYKNVTLEQFLTVQNRGGFATFIDNQQTRWHCGTGYCVDKRNEVVTRDMLNHAIHNLNKMHAVLILEQMSSPQSCTRRQMRRVLNFSALESFSDERAKENAIKATSRHSATDWENAVRPHLDATGRSTNTTKLQGFGFAESNHSKALTMAALALHNDMDMQLYGYALHLCEVLADKYDPLLLQNHEGKAIVNSNRTMFPLWEATNFAWAVGAGQTDEVHGRLSDGQK